MEHRPAFVVTSEEGKKTSETSRDIWKTDMSRKIIPQCESVTTRYENLIIKPLNKEMLDVLKSLAKDTNLLREESLLWPRFIIRGVQATLSEDFVQAAVIDQNLELGISTDSIHTVVRPIFKSGRRDLDVTNWIVEVNPKFYENFMKADTIYIGFMKCRISNYEEVTQCYLCLRFGHPAAKCRETENICAHCGKKGHLAADSPTGEADPKCSNCGGKHVTELARLGQATLSRRLRGRTTVNSNECASAKIRAAEYGVSSGSQQPNWSTAIRHVLISRLCRSRTPTGFGLGKPRKAPSNVRNTGYAKRGNQR